MLQLPKSFEFHNFIHNRVVEESLRNRSFFSADEDILPIF
jgi:hypothetical protein